MNKKEKPRRRSLNERLDEELAATEDIPLAGVNPESKQTSPQPTITLSPSTTEKSRGENIITKKATTIMPKEVFMALQRYCINHDTPKHRALYLFIVDGLYTAGEITDEDYNRFREMASQLTTTYEKKK